VRLSIEGFLGANNAMQPMMLQNNVGVLSLNQNPSRGDLRPWREPLDVATIPAGTKTIYRMGRDVASDTQYWLTWATRVHAMRGFIPDDTTERTFYTGDGIPKQTDNTIALGGTPYPNAWRALGVPVPTVACLLVELGAGVADDTEIRYYTYTYVTDKGEESAPAPVSLPVSGKSDATWTINNLGAAPAGPYGINRIRVYRTQTGQAGDTEFFFLREIVSTLDTTTDDGRELGEVLPTDGWLPPHAEMKCLTPMWNGMAAGIVPGGAVRYCVAYKPYAWPVAFESLPADTQAVGLAVFGQSLLVLTTGRPILVGGASPESLTDEPLEFAESCVSEPGIVSFGHGVAWPAPDGLAYFGGGGAKLITGGVLTRDDWLAMNPHTMIGGMYEGAYLGIYTQGGVKKAFLIDPLNPTGIYYLEAGYDGLYFDQLQDALYLIDGIQVRKWNAGSDVMQARFRSKVFRVSLSNFAGGRLIGKDFPATFIVDAMGMQPAAVAARVADNPDLFSAPDATTLRYTKTVPDGEVFRLPGGFSCREWQLEVRTSGSVQQIAIASSLSVLSDAA